MHKTLFLDFDGVLHDKHAADDLSTFESIFADATCFEHAGLLAQMLEGHDVQIVVHSGWRLNNQFTQDQLRQFLKTLGTRFVGITPISTDPDQFAKWRYRSIVQYIADHGITDYRILDDQAHEFPAGLSKLIVCNETRGVDDPLVQAQIKEWFHG